VVRVLSEGVVHTKMQKRIINKMIYVYFYNLKTFYLRWRMEASNKTKHYFEKVKAKVIDKFVYAGMSKPK